MRKFASGIGSLLGQSIVYPVPIPLAPGPYKGAMVAGLDPDDGRVKPYFSDGDEWLNNVFSSDIAEIIEVELSNITLEPYTDATLPNPALTVNERRLAFNTDKGLPGFVWNDEWLYVTDEARAAEIAEEVAKNTFVIVDEPIKVTVGPTGDYLTLVAALEFAATVQAVKADVEYIVEVEIQDGVEIAEQLVFRGVDLGRVRITAAAADNVVDVNVDDFTVNTSIATRPVFMAFIGSTAPQIDCAFARKLVSTPLDPTQDYTGEAAGVTALDLRSSQIANSFTSIAKGPIGFTDFEFGAFIGGGSTFRLDQFNINARQTGISIFGRSTGNYIDGSVQGALRSIVVSESQLNLDGAVDYRKTGSSAPEEDLRVFNQSTVTIDADCLGGLPPQGGINGYLLDARDTGVRTGATFLRPKGANPLPAASDHPNQIIVLTGTGPVYSDGTNWFPFTLGSAL